MQGKPSTSACLHGQGAKDAPLGGKVLLRACERSNIAFSNRPFKRPLQQSATNAIALDEVAESNLGRQKMPRTGALCSPSAASQLRAAVRAKAEAAQANVDLQMKVARLEEELRRTREQLRREECDLEHPAALREAQLANPAHLDAGSPAVASSQWMRQAGCCYRRRPPASPQVVANRPNALQLTAAPRAAAQQLMDAQLRTPHFGKEACERSAVRSAPAAPHSIAPSTAPAAPSKPAIRSAVATGRGVFASPPAVPSSTLPAAPAAAPSRAPAPAAQSAVPSIGPSVAPAASTKAASASASSSASASAAPVLPPIPAIVLVPGPLPPKRKEDNIEIDGAAQAGEHARRRGSQPLVQQKAPAWSEDLAFLQEVEQQSDLDPESIFGRVPLYRHAEIFPPSLWMSLNIRQRNIDESGRRSSQCWTQEDRSRDDEVRHYRIKMGHRRKWHPGQLQQRQNH
mmetsp:Transcript_1237/g.2721  ORF Transcript_1237/g.2721 Transcript_1237/m.2721 type:complete len:458 (+) Transcript_1237:131-1504(+)